MIRSYRNTKKFRTALTTIFIFMHYTYICSQRLNLFLFLLKKLATLPIAHQRLQGMSPFNNAVLHDSTITLQYPQIFTTQA